MNKKTLEEAIAEKREKGKDRIVISVSFRFTDDFELGLLEHIWQQNHSKLIKRILQRDKEGVMPIPNFSIQMEVEVEDEDVSSFY